MRKAICWWDLGLLQEPPGLAILDHCQGSCSRIKEALPLTTCLKHPLHRASEEGDLTTAPPK